MTDVLLAVLVTAALRLLVRFESRNPAPVWTAVVAESEAPPLPPMQHPADCFCTGPHSD